MVILYGMPFYIKGESGINENSKDKVSEKYGGGGDDWDIWWVWHGFET